ncbi:hypothetical protein ACFYU9_30575 [Streptomyces sp. NPDC004327]
MAGTPVLYERRGPVAYVTTNRPRHRDAWPPVPATEEAAGEPAREEAR